MFPRSVRTRTCLQYSCSWTKSSSSPSVAVGAVFLDDDDCFVSRSLLNAGAFAYKYSLEFWECPPAKVETRCGTGSTRISFVPVFECEKFILSFPLKNKKKRKSKGHKTHHFQSVLSEIFQVLSRGLHQVQQVRSSLRTRLWRCLFAQFLLFHTMVCDDDVSFKTCCLARKTSAHAYSLCCCL